MWLKENRITLLIYVLAFGTVFFVEDKVVVMVLIASLLLVHIAGLLREKARFDLIENDVVSEVSQANDRADGAYDRLVHLINAIPSPLVYINQRGDFEVSNVNFNRLVNSESMNAYDIAIDSTIRQTILDAFLNEKQFARQLNYREVDYQVISIPLLQEGRYNGCVMVFQDVTAVAMGERMQKQFIADASHELRTPITSIKGMSEIMNREGFDDWATAKEFIAQIDKENKRLEQIVDDLLLQSRLKQNKVHLEKSMFNLRQFFDGIIFEKRQQLHQENIKVELECPEDLMIRADHFRMSQVVLNLLNNAINYSKDGEIKISCQAVDNMIEIKFKDSGAGIPQHMLPQIFERFFKGNPDRARTNSGSGLGLAISKSIIEAHGGTISVESEEGVGTTFTILMKYNNF